MTEHTNDPLNSPTACDHGSESYRLTPPESPSGFCENVEDRCRICREMEARLVRSEDLLQGHRELLIMHGGNVYRLIRTRNDKLILQK